MPGAGLPHRRAVLATGTPSGAGPGCGPLGRQQLRKARDSPRGLQWPVCPRALCRRGGEGVRRGTTPLLSSSPALCLSSGTGQKSDSNNMKRVPVALVSAELHPQPLLRCWRGQLSALVLEPPPVLRFSAWLCPLCDFGISLSCMRLCTWLRPRGEGFSIQLPSAPVCVCRAAGGQGSSVSAPSDPWLAFAGGQREENHGPGRDEKIAAA